jgi:hypothetical protein
VNSKKRESTVEVGGYLIGKRIEESHVTNNHIQHHKESAMETREHLKTVKRLNEQINVLKKLCGGYEKKISEVLAILFCLLNREPNRASLITTSELRKAGILELYRLTTVETADGLWVQVKHATDDTRKENSPIPSNLDKKT